MQSAGLGCSVGRWQREAVNFSIGGLGDPIMNHLTMLLASAAAMAATTAASGQQIILPAFQPPSRAHANCHPSRHSVMPRSPGEESLDDVTQASRLRAQVRAEAALRKQFVVRVATRRKSPRSEVVQQMLLAKNYQKYLDRQAHIWMAANAGVDHQLPTSPGQQRPQVTAAVQRQVAQHREMQRHGQTGT